MLYHYPKTKEANVREKIHGTTVFDPYRWLEGDTAEVKRGANAGQICSFCIGSVATERSFRKVPLSAYEGWFSRCSLPKERLLLHDGSKLSTGSRGLVGLQGITGQKKDTYRSK